MKSISIKFLFGAALAVIAVLVLLFGASVGRLEAASERVTSANQARYASYLLADELRQSSDDLTRLVRTYTVTAEPKWAEQYQEVLDIRNGIKPRPSDYEKIYWDFRAANIQPNKGSSSAIAVTQQNAALVEEMAAEAVSLRSQAADLVQVVAVFQLGSADLTGQRPTTLRLS